MQKHSKKLIIFDFDGVLADSIGMVLEFYNILADKYGLKKAESEKDISKLFHENVYVGLKKAGLDESRSAEFLEDMKRLTLEFKEKLEPFEGVPETLRKLHEEENTLAIVSSNHSEVIDNFLRQNNLLGIFGAIHGAENLTSKVEKINRLSEKTDISKSDTYYVGDTKGDIKEGKEAGVKTVAACWGYHSKEELQSAGPDFLAETVGELESIFFK
jgi:phosphoglycolate phosphatase